MASKASPKREVPKELRKLLELDAAVTEKFCLLVNQYLPFRSSQAHYKALEISCHGIPWLAGWLAFVWLINASSLYQMQVNFYIGLLLDIVLVAVIKAYVRRRRPSANSPDMFAAIGPDQYSFPSGHASRAAFIAYFYLFLYRLPLFFWPPLLAWCTSICVSRILLRRHHILDVLAGVGLGIVEGLIVGYIWLGQDASAYLLQWLTDDKLEGGDFHV